MIDSTKARVQPHRNNLTNTVRLLLLKAQRRDSMKFHLLYANTIPRDAPCELQEVLVRTPTTRLL